MTHQLTGDCRSPSILFFALRVVNKLRQIFCKLLIRRRRYRQAQIDRLAFRQLLLLDDDLLDDIGVTRSDVEWANELPIHQSAAQALETVKRRARPKIRP